MKKRRIGRIVWGIALVIVGVIFALNVLGITEIKIFFDGWWALFIIVPSFVGLFSNRDKLGSLFGLGIGVALLLSAQGIFDFSLVWKLLIPFIIVLIGLRLIFPSSWRRCADTLVFIREIVFSIIRIKRQICWMLPANFG
jgi:hypothetical protein